MIDKETGLPISDTNGSHPDKVLSEFLASMSKENEPALFEENEVKKQG